MKPSQIIQALEFLLFEIHQPTMLWGTIGVGKSSIVRALAALKNKNIKKKADHYGVIDLRLAQCDPTEVKGFPMPNAQDKTMEFFPMAMLPTKGNGILLLDEINHAPFATQAPAYQLVLDRRIGDYVLPDGWQIMAAGNLSTDRSGVQAMSAALANRFVHLEYTADHEEWVDWGMVMEDDKPRVSDVTRGYIRMRPGSLVADKIEPGARAFNTPRSLAVADKIINSKLPADVMLPILKGTVGEGVATELAGFARDRHEMPNIDRIMINPEDVPVPEKPSVKYAVVAALEARVSPDNFGRLLKYVKRLGRDFEVVFATGCDRRNPEISESKDFTAWLRENRDVLLGR